MFKGKPFLIAAFVFGGLSLIMLILTVISFFSDDHLISEAICSMMNLEKDAFTDATMAQIAVVLCLPTFIFAFRSFADSEEESALAAAVPAAVPAYEGNTRSSITEASVVVEDETDGETIVSLTDNAEERVES